MKKQQAGKMRSFDRMQWWIVLTLAFAILVMLTISARDGKVAQTNYRQAPVSVSFVIPDYSLI